MKINEVVTVVAVSGAEYVGKFRKETEDYFVIGEPHIVSAGQNEISFMPTVAMTGAPHIGEATFYKTGVLLVVRTAEEVSKQYTTSVSGIVL